MREQQFNEALDFANGRNYNEAIKLLQVLLEEGLNDTIHYKALKLYADIIGPLAGHNYMTAIDMYQQIINESEDDALYESAQISILDAYLSLSIAMMETYESTRDVIESDSEQVVQFINKLDEKREAFLTQRAEAIYKSRI